METKNKVRGTQAIEMLQIVGKVITLGGQSIRVLEKNNVGLYTRAEGTAAATTQDALAIYAKGALYTKTDAATGVKSIYENIGTSALSSFNLIGKVVAADITDTTGISELGVLKTANVLYDFAVHGGTAGTIVLTGAPTIPDNAVVTAFNWDVLTTCTSATDAATIAIQFPVDGVLTTAVAINAATNTWDIGPHGAFDTGSLVKKTTAARIPSLLVAGAENLTAGKILFHLQYYISA